MPPTSINVPMIGPLTHVGLRLPALCLSHSNTMMPFRTPTQASSAGPALPVSHDWVFAYGRRCCGHMWVEKVDTALISLSLSSKQASATRSCRALRSTQQGRLSQVRKQEGTSWRAWWWGWDLQWKQAEWTWERQRFSKMAGCLWMYLSEKSLFSPVLRLTSSINIFYNLTDQTRQIQNANQMAWFDFKWEPHAGYTGAGL